MDTDGEREQAQRCYAKLLNPSAWASSCTEKIFFFFYFLKKEHPRIEVLFDVNCTAWTLVFFNIKWLGCIPVYLFVKMAEWFYRNIVLEVKYVLSSFTRRLPRSSICFT